MFLKMARTRLEKNNSWAKQPQESIPTKFIIGTRTQGNTSDTVKGTPDEQKVNKYQPK